MRSNYHHSEETKAKMRAVIRKPRPPVTEETRKRMSESARLKKGKYHCSASRRAKMIGKKTSEETKAKMREAHAKRLSSGYVYRHSPETLEKMSRLRKGFRLSEETRAKQSATMRRVLPKGKDHHAWKGGRCTQNELIRSSSEYKLWREAVFKRDNYTCIWCGKNGGLNADHIKPFCLYPELRFAIDNGRTLCEPCHKTTDTFGGRANKK